MKRADWFPKRMARYGACIMFLGALGVVSLVGAFKGVPVERLWPPLFWGGLASLFLGWAVGHTAGRLFLEAQSKEGGQKKRVESGDVSSHKDKAKAGT